MPYLASIGTYLPCWGAPRHRVAGDDEDAIRLEVHDFFTGIELISYEDLGFAERFGAYKLVEAEVTSVGGALPVNPSGGLKAKGHPPGATGVAQCVELFAQLRGEAANQVDGARVALAHNIGGPTAVSAVTILEGSANGAG